MARQDDLIGLIKDVSSEPGMPMQRQAYGSPTTESTAAGYGGGPNANQASPTKKSGLDAEGRFSSRSFFQALPIEVRRNVDPGDIGGGLDVMSVVQVGGPGGGDAPLAVFKWPVKGSVIS